MDDGRSAGPARRDKALPGRRAALAVLLGGAVAGLAACSGDGARTSGPVPTATGPAGATPTSEGVAGGAGSAGATEPDVGDAGEGTAGAGDRSGVGDPHVTVVATAVVDELQVHPRPADPDDPGDAAGQTVEQVLDRREEVTGQVVLLALEVGRAWVHVQLPVRPNGSTGWVRARDVRLGSHRFAVEVLLSEHRLVVTEAGREVLASGIGVGTRDTPTPGGDYFVKELLAPPDPTGVYGPYAYGLSGFSTVLTEFAGGEGVIGIHGTDRPDRVGTDVSSGCIRLPNEVITELVEDIGLPLGTPVTIRA